MKGGPTKVMFLCTGNSCRSQIAEGLARHYGAGIIEAYSAGVMPVGVHPFAIETMKEIGIDISNQSSKAIDEEELKQMDLIITLCPVAESACMNMPINAKRLHWPIKDPITATGSKEDILEAFRSTRETLKEKILKLIDDIKNCNLP